MCSIADGDGGVFDRDKKKYKILLSVDVRCICLCNSWGGRDNNGYNIYSVGDISVCIEKR